MSIKFGTQRTNAGDIQTQDTTNTQNAGQGKMSCQKSNNEAIENERLGVTKQKACTA